MPIYEYRCTECGKDFEKRQKITDDPLAECIYCSGKIRKLISNTSFHLKGTGWYVTDYAKKSGASQDDEAPKKSKAKETESSSSSSSSSSASETSTPSAAKKETSSTPDP